MTLVKRGRGWLGQAIVKDGNGKWKWKWKMETGNGRSNAHVFVGMRVRICSYLVTLFFLKDVRQISLPSSLLAVWRKDKPR